MTRFPLLPAFTALLALATPRLCNAKCGEILSGLTKVEKLTQQHHSTVLLRCYGYRETDAGFVIVRDGKAQEFSPELRYKKTSTWFLSTDGTKVAYRGDLDKSYELAVFDLVNRKMSLFYSRDNQFLIGGWTPDRLELGIKSASSDQLEFIRLADGVVARTVRLNADDSGQLLMSPDLQKAILLQPVGSLGDKKDFSRMRMSTVDLSNGRKNYLIDGNDATWSPRGDQIAYCNALESNCFVMSPSGGKPKHLFGARSKLSAAFLYSSFRGPLVWSPDQRFLVFHEPAGVQGSDDNAYV